MNTPINKEKYFYNLDALRFIAFLGVFFSHTLRWQPNNFALDTFFGFITLTYFGVPFFFTLSSFLITYNLLSEKIKSGHIGLLRFYANRALRIWPIYFLIILVAFFILPLLSPLLHIKSPTVGPVIPFLFFFVNFYIIGHGNNFSFIILILWSVSIEEQFYFFWGAAFKFITVTRIIYLFILLLAASIFYSYYYISIPHSHPVDYLIFNTLYAVQNFFSGALLAWMFLTQKKIYTRLKKIPSWFLLLVYCTLPLVCSNLITLDMVTLNVIKSVCFGLIIYDQALNDKRTINLGKFAIINYFGKISYGLYIYHALVITLLSRFFNFFDPVNHSSLPLNIFQVIIAFIITAIVAHLSYKYIELKFLAMKIKK